MHRDILSVVHARPGELATGVVVRCLELKAKDLSG